MALVVVTESAAADQADILEDLHFKAGRRTALKYRGSFSRLYDRLEAHPASGPRRPALGGRRWAPTSGSGSSRHTS